MMAVMANPPDELHKVLQRIRGNQLAAQKAAADMAAAIKGNPPPKRPGDGGGQAEGKP